VVAEAPPGAELAGGFRWEDFRRKGDPTFVPRQREDTACIVYSSGTGGRPKGCVLTHENYLEQCKSLTALYPFWPGVRYFHRTNWANEQGSIDAEIVSRSHLHLWLLWLAGALLLVESFLNWFTGRHAR